MPRKKYAPPPPPDFVNQPMIDDDGRVSTITMPVKGANWQTIDRRASFSPQSCPALSDYLSSRDIRQLKIALSLSPSARGLRFLRAISDPTKADIDIVTLAEENDIGPIELMQIWRNYKLTTAFGNLIERTPEVAADTVEDAMSIKVCCGRCDGAGSIRVTRESGQEWITCVNCDGSGTVRKIGDAKSREYVFEATGIIKPTPTTNNFINGGITTNNITVESVIDELDRLSPVIPVTAIALPADDG